ncbi:MAG: GatB/YqeY domain-containing protein [Woeseiaceae bacterium]
MTTTSNYALRLQKSLLEEVKRIAAEENTTINQFINVAVAEKAAALRTEAYFRERAGRADLAASERQEIEVLKDYLPEQLSDDELVALVDAVIADTGAEGIRDMGKVMGQIKAKAAGRADMGAVSVTVKERLNAL